MTAATQIALALRELAPEKKLLDPEVVHIDAIAALWAARTPAQPQSGSIWHTGAGGAPQPADGLTARIVMELISHEAIVQEAYKDSVGVWTWAVGVTNASGHEVFPRYKDQVQPLRKCLETSIWLMRTKYLPDVLAAFSGRTLTESQLGAALSFHYNTGAIKHASWVKSFLAGKPTQAKAEIMEYRRPASIIERREKERDLFFDGKWTATGKATVWPVRKPSYTPDWSHPQRVDIRADLEAILGGGQ